MVTVLIIVDSVPLAVALWYSPSLTAVLPALYLTRVLAPGSILVLQAEEHENLPTIATGDDWDIRVYGRNQLWFRHVPGGEAGEPVEEPAAEE